MNLQAKQKEILTKMLTQLGSSSDDSKQFHKESSWKILVYDTLGRDILAPLFSVGELKRLGVTLHLQLHSRREKVSDVPAVYFVRPSRENQERILVDMNSHVYESVYLNFTNMSSATLDWFAERVASLPINPANVIMRVMDQCVEFVSLEKYLYTFGHQHSSLCLYGRTLSDKLIQGYIDLTASNIFTMIITLSTVPLIRVCTQQKGPATYILESLLRLFKEKYQDVSTLRSNSVTMSQRPVLLLVDRQLDIAAPFYHSSSYIGLMDDILGFNNNKVSLPKSETDKTLVSHEIDVQDNFWLQNSVRPFPDVAEVVVSDLDTYKREANAIQAQKGNSVDSDSNAQLNNALTNLPMMRKKKKHLELLVDVGMCIVNHVKKHKSDEYTAQEEQILDGSMTNADILGFLKSMPQNTWDNLRIALIWGLHPTCTDVVYKDMVQIIHSNIPSDVELSEKDKEKVQSVLIFLEKTRNDRKQLSLVGSNNNTNNNTNNTNNRQGDGYLASFAQKVQNNTLQGSATRAALPIVALTAKHIANSADCMSGFQQVDPLNSSAMTSVSTQPNRHMLVFVAGAGCYNEYVGLRQLSQSGVPGVSGSVEIIYATSEMVSANTYLEQCAMQKDGDKVEQIAQDMQKP